MTASPLTVEELREELGLTPLDDGAPSHAALARLLRLAVARWSPTSRSELYRWLGDLVTLADLNWPEQVKPRVEETLDQLIRLGDVEAVSIGEREEEPDDDAPDEDAPALSRPPRRGLNLLATPPRVVRLGDRLLLCGCAEMNDAQLDAATLPPEPGLAGVLRWFTPDAPALRGLPQVSAEEWLGYPDHRRIMDRRAPRADDDPNVASGPQKLDLGALWAQLQREVQAQAPHAVSGELRVIVGRPGDFFSSAMQGDGRWRPLKAVPPGVYGGARPATGRGTQERWRPVLIELLDDRRARILDLYDWDELAWAQLSRGVATGAPEQVRLREGVIVADVSLPHQLQRLMALGVREGWRSRPPPEALEAILTSLKDRGGLTVVSQ
ncbi:MAG: hypothetical protein IPN01_36020 [Deltaproteobacteria bacterium]|nr:hypothetical protein [Deltaproteobacteria bacterium]